MANDDEFDDEEIKLCALDTVLACLRAEDSMVEAAWRQAVADRRMLKALDIAVTG